MKTRVVTALAVGGVAIATVLWLPSWALSVLLGLFWLTGAWEWAQFSGELRVPGAAYAVCFLILMLLSELFLDSSGITLVAAIAIGWWIVAIGLLWSYPRGLSTVVVLLAGPLTLIPAWILLSYLHGLGPQGPALTLSLLAIVWAADIGAYFTGRQFGSVKLAPRVSPGKTWEGVGGGVLLAALTAAVAAAILDTNMVAFVAIALAATLVSVIGDLTVSMFKRQVGLKDSGRLLPGHGGVLDRIDSLAAAVPFFFFGLHLAGLWI